MKTYDELSDRSQRTHMRSLAREVLAGYPIDVANLRVLNHDFNTTFRVDTIDGERFALRINVNSHRTAEIVGGEVAWVTAVGTDSDVRVATPLRTHDGDTVSTVHSALLDRVVPAVVYSWLHGRDLGDDPPARQVYAVGRAMARLHDHAATWKPPAGVTYRRVDSTLMDSTDHVSGGHGALSDGQRDEILIVKAAADRAFADLGTTTWPQLIHGDIHGWNVKYHDGDVSVFDFDDCGIGQPMQDLAIAAYYLRPDDRAEAALYEGYASVRPLPPVGGATFETLVAARNVVLLNDVLESVTAGTSEFLARYVPNTVTKLRQFLECGVFRHDVPGLLPIA